MNTCMLYASSYKYVLQHAYDNMFMYNNDVGKKFVK